MPRPDLALLIPQARIAVTEHFPFEAIPAKRATMPGLLDLPPELIERIFWEMHMPRPDVARNNSLLSDKVAFRHFMSAVLLASQLLEWPDISRLSRTCKRLQDILEPLIYREIRLVSIWPVRRRTCSTNHANTTHRTLSCPKLVLRSGSYDLAI